MAADVPGHEGHLYSFGFADDVMDATGVVDSLSLRLLDQDCAG